MSLNWHFSANSQEFTATTVCRTVMRLGDRSRLPGDAAQIVDGDLQRNRPTHIDNSERGLIVALPLPSTVRILKLGRCAMGFWCPFLYRLIDSFS